MRQIDADKLEREITLAYIEIRRGLTFEQIDAVARFSAKVISIIGHTPAADAEPIKHGRWIEDEYGILRCSECQHGKVYKTNYCPNCGVRMDEVENDQRTSNS